MQTGRAFTQAIGQWVGSAEVYDGSGRFVGNGMDMRHVQKLSEDETRIDVTFVGPFKASGYYIIQARPNERFYKGPINIGHAEVLSEGLVDANAYWADLGLTQRFFLYVLPDGKTQLSLAQMSRGDQLIYTVVGENRMVQADAPNAQPTLTPGTAYDLHDDPNAGRAVSLWTRTGTWCGTMTLLEEGKPAVSYESEETITTEDGALCWQFASPLLPEAQRVSLHTNGWQAWTQRGALVGSLNQCGGRATSGYFYHMDGLRVWRREVISLDGNNKALLQLWYRGSQRVATAYGVLAFAPA